ncbi:MAG: S1 RNA-binding domain-containing protein [Candidatus Aenigmarchaeota archaeon]|nr:S1 RNA-binding domain-containing protein [Candidatus Aenigmarchaeota archaeon]
MVRRKGLPQCGELIICKVARITQFAAWCKLEEYPEAEGMIHISEVAGKHVYDIRDFVKRDKQYVAKVIRIDYQKNIVNLSLKRVSVKEGKRKLNLFRKEQRAEKILEQVSKEIGKNLDQGYEEVGFLLQENFGRLFDAFERIKKSPHLLEELGVSKEWQSSLKKVLEKSFVEKEVTITAELDLKLYRGDGIDKIKELLIDLERESGASISYISAPKYRVEIRTKNPKDVEKRLFKRLENVVRKAEKLGGEGNYKL